MCAAAVTWVNMRRMSAEEIEAYVASGQSDGKAGAYAIQADGDKFVEKLEGSFLNVVGFPLELFEELLPRALRDWRL
ncbi:MAG: Maf family protein [Planctomycetota bacterium]|nr:Maf family protein [Planctomycetota bacterium]